MAAPSSVTPANISGVWCLDKKLSDDIDPVMSLQGVGWLIRKAMGNASLTLTVTHNTAASPPTLEIAQSATGMPSPPPDTRVLNWTAIARKTPLFGEETRQTRMVSSANGAPAIDLQIKSSDAKKTEDLRKFLLAQHDISGKTGNGQGWLVSGDVAAIQGYIVNASGVTLEEIWGFETVKNEKRLTRRMAAVKDGKVAKARLVYTYGKK